MSIPKLLVAAGTRIIGREKARRAVTVVQFAKKGGAGEDVVTGIEGIAPETIARAHVRPSLGHELHQAECAFG